MRVAITESAIATGRSRRRSLRRREMCASRTNHTSYCVTPNSLCLELSLFLQRESNKYCRSCLFNLLLIQFIFYNQSTNSSTLSNNFLQPHNTSTMAARSRLPLIAGLGAATFGGYYMYRAGGNPKVAEKQIERMYLSSMTSAAATNIVQTTPPASHQQQEMSCPVAPRSSRPRQRSTASRLARRLTAL